jgi:hypothetical protein
MFKDSAIILDAIRRSFFIKSATAAMFLSVRVDFGLPLLSSSSTSYFSSRNGEYHLKRLIGSQPHSHKASFCTNTSVSVAGRPVMKQKFYGNSLFISAVHDV